MVMGGAQQQRNLTLQALQQQQYNDLMQQQGAAALGKNIGGLVSSALAKRNDGINDSIGNGIRYTNDGAKKAFNEEQIQALQQFANNNMDTSQKYGALANQKFTINGQKYQADKDGVFSAIPQQNLSPEVVKAAIGVPEGASKIFGNNASVMDTASWLKNDPNSITII